MKKSYTLNTDDVIVDKEDNRRYTMRDIGSLERRLKNVEYYTQIIFTRKRRSVFTDTRR